jgi:hypothetical protein
VKKIQGLAYVLEIYEGEKKISITVSSQQNYGILDFRKRDLFENQTPLFVPTA